MTSSPKRTVPIMRLRLIPFLLTIHTVCIVFVIYANCITRSVSAARRRKTLTCVIPTGTSGPCGLTGMIPMTQGTGRTERDSSGLAPWFAPNQSRSRLRSCRDHSGQLRSPILTPTLDSSVSMTNSLKINSVPTLKSDTAAKRNILV